MNSPKWDGWPLQVREERVSNYGTMMGKSLEPFPGVKCSQVLL